MAFTDNSTGGRVVEEGRMACKITLGGAVKAGDLIGYSSGWKQADGNGGIYAELIAGEAGASADVITAYREAVIGNITTGTAGNTLYLSDTAGGYSASTGTVTQKVGHELGDSRMLIVPQYVAMLGLISHSPYLLTGYGNIFDVNVNGAATGHIYALSGWVNIGTSGTIASRWMWGGTFGVYAPSGADLSSGNIAALDISTYVPAANPPSAHYMMRFNTDQSGDTPDAWFFASNPEAIALTLDANTGATKVGAIKISVTGGGGDQYIWTYDSTGA